MAKITSIHARQILDSRATPTVEVTISLDTNINAVASCPSGASVSIHEALELRDNNRSVYGGKGVLQAVENVNEVIGPSLIGKDPSYQNELDLLMNKLDGTENKTKLGANAILPVSLALARVSAQEQKIPLYKYLRNLTSHNDSYEQPISAFNILNGGMHAGGNIDFQEFMILPTTKIFPKALEQAVTIYTQLKKLLHENSFSNLLGDEGGFAPNFSKNTEALDYLLLAIKKAGYVFQKDVEIGMDVAASSFYDDGIYNLKSESKKITPEELLVFYKSIYEKYPLRYFEDPFYEEDFDSFAKITKTLPASCVIIGDDIISTNSTLLQKAINAKAITGVIIKVNQIGTVTETLQVIELAKKNNIKTIISHRSGETTDDFIADLAIAVNSDFTKFGAPARGERVVKYNRLLEIYSELHKA